MPLVRISDKLYQKIQEIMRRTGWRTIGYTLDKLTEQINPNDFSTVEIEVFFKVKETKEKTEGDGGEN